MISITARLQLWIGKEGSAHFISILHQDSFEVRAHALMNPRGFRSVRVECTISGFTWRTSLFPQKGGSYFLPVKADVCRSAGMAEGDEVRVDLRLL